jgi:hypothetical protein
MHQLMDQVLRLTAEAVHRYERQGQGLPHAGHWHVPAHGYALGPGPGGASAPGMPMNSRRAGHGAPQAVPAP